MKTCRSLAYIVVLIETTKPLRYCKIYLHMTSFPMTSTGLNIEQRSRPYLNKYSWDGMAACLFIPVYLQVYVREYLQFRIVAHFAEVKHKYNPYRPAICQNKNVRIYKYIISYSLLSAWGPTNLSYISTFGK